MMKHFTEKYFLLVIDHRIFDVMKALLRTSHTSLILTFVGYDKYGYQGRLIVKQLEMMNNLSHGSSTGFLIVRC